MSKKQKFYSVGEIFRLKLLLNHRGQPCKDKATVSRIVRRFKEYRVIKTPYGGGYAVSLKEIHTHNKKMTRLQSAGATLAI